MHNVFLNERSERDIDKRVAKVLKDLGTAEPPVHLELVRELLKLDRAYYSSCDGTAIQETVHRLKVAGKQVVRRPCLLIDAIRKLNLKALYVPDRKRILIDSELPSAKQRWGEAHEIGHSIIPWHEAVMHGDKKRTLSVTCQHEVEAEANFAAGRLLFMQDAFNERLLGSAVSFKRVKDLSKEFKNTMTTTLWRTVEAMETVAFGLVSQHPNDVDANKERFRYFLRSREFERKFGSVSASQVFAGLQGFCFGRRGPIGSDEVVFNDLNGREHIFFVEAFYNHHEALTLGVYQQERIARVSGC